MILVNLHLAGEPVVQSDHRHAEVEQVGDDGEQRRLLAAVLRRRRREGAAYLALEAPFAHRRPAGSRKLAIWDDILPKRVPVPTTMRRTRRSRLVELVVGCLGGLRR